MAPFFLVQLCHPMHRIKQRLFALPVVINFLVAIGSWHTGLVARLGPQGQYIRGRCLFFHLRRQLFIWDGCL